MPRSSKKRHIEEFNADGEDDQASANNTIDEKQNLETIQQSNSDDGLVAETRKSVWKERRALERFRIGMLMELKEERRRNELKKKEVELFQSFVENQKEDEELDNHVKQAMQEFEMAQQQENIVSLNLRGKIFVTTMNTLCKRDNMLRVMLESQIGIDKDEGGCILIDRNPDHFPIILEHLRTGSTTHIGIWEEATKKNIKRLKKLLEESDFFGTEKLTIKVRELIDRYKKDYDESKKYPVEDTHFTPKLVDESEDCDFYSKFAMLTLEEKSNVENYVKEQKEKINREFEELQEMEMSKNSSVDITFNVRGVKFVLSKSKLLRDRDSLFYTIVKNSAHSEIFMDRDPDVFKTIYEYLMNGTIDSFPIKLETKKQVYNEASYFGLNGLLDYFDICRYPIEEIGEKNMKYKREEDFLRNLFAVDRDNIVLNDPYLNLINIYGSSNNIRKSFRKKDPVLETSKLLFNFEEPREAVELTKKSSLKIPNIPEICDSREQFLKQFDIFTNGIFKGIDWSNIFVAGGSVLASCLKISYKEAHETSLFCPARLRNTELLNRQKMLVKVWGNDDASDEETNKVENTSEDEYVTDEESNWGNLFQPNTIIPEEEKIRSVFNEKPWKKSDIDLFLYGLSESEAEKKIIYIYNTFKKNLSDEDILLFRTQHAITFKFGQGTKSVQIILRIYKSPAEVLMGFDIPCCSIGFSGSQVFCLPRAREAIRTRCNIVDPERQSTTYETRLVKYAMRGFRIGVCGYDSKKITNPFLLGGKRLYLNNFTGLARILLIINSFKRAHEFDAVAAISGKRTLESVDKTLLTPSKKHDYSQVDLAFKYESAGEGFRIIDSRVKYLAKNLKKKPFFEYVLNDIQEILRPKDMKSDLPAHVEFIQIDPGRQHIGSFHTTSYNFLGDAYLFSKNKRVSKIKYISRKWNTPDIEFDFKTSALIERAIREYRTNCINDASLIVQDGKYRVDLKNSTLYEINGKKEVKIGTLSSKQLFTKFSTSRGHKENNINGSGSE